MKSRQLGMIREEEFRRASSAPVRIRPRSAPVHLASYFVDYIQRSTAEELGGEIEFLLGGEKHTITKTCLIFVPKGVSHCPITLRRIDTPIFMFEAANDPEYVKEF